jgi:succinate dehydrogenase / fumarate reductase cytochrome b subunit
MKDRPGALRMARGSDGKWIERPLSPHLQIYRPQITSALSIFHRITGVGLGVGTLLLVWWLAAAAGSDADYAAAAGFIGSPLGLLLLFLWTGALVYHFLNGLRHLAWDAGRGFALPEVHASGKLVLAATVVLTLLIWVVGLVIW